VAEDFLFLVNVFGSVIESCGTILVWASKITNELSHPCYSVLIFLLFGSATRLHYITSAVGLYRSTRSLPSRVKTHGHVSPRETAEKISASFRSLTRKKFIYDRKYSMSVKFYHEGNIAKLNFYFGQVLFCKLIYWAHQHLFLW